MRNQERQERRKKVLEDTSFRTPGQQKLAEMFGFDPATGFTDDQDKELQKVLRILIPNRKLRQKYYDELEDQLLAAESQGAFDNAFEQHIDYLLDEPMGEPSPIIDEKLSLRQRLLLQEWILEILPDDKYFDDSAEALEGMVLSKRKDGEFMDVVNEVLDNFVIAINKENFDKHIEYLVEQERIKAGLGILEKTE